MTAGGAAVVATGGGGAVVAVGAVGDVPPSVVSVVAADPAGAVVGAEPLVVEVGGRAASS